MTENHLVGDGPNPALPSDPFPAVDAAFAALKQAERDYHLAFEAELQARLVYEHHLREAERQGLLKGSNASQREHYAREDLLVSEYKTLEKAQQTLREAALNRRLADIEVRRWETRAGLTELARLGG